MDQHKLLALFNGIFWNLYISKEAKWLTIFFAYHQKKKLEIQMSLPEI